MSGIAISVSGLLAQGRKVDNIARNIANINSFPEPGNVLGNIPIDTVTISRQGGGVDAVDVTDPNASLEDQIVGLISAKNSYAADAKVIKAQDEMDKAILDIIT